MGRRKRARPSGGLAGCGTLPEWRPFSPWGCCASSCDERAATAHGGVFAVLRQRSARWRAIPAAQPACDPPVPSVVARHRASPCGRATAWARGTLARSAAVMRVNVLEADHSHLIPPIGYAPASNRRASKTKRPRSEAPRPRRLIVWIVPAQRRWLSNSGLSAVTRDIRNLLKTGRNRTVRSRYWGEAYTILRLCQGFDAQITR